MKYIAIVTSGFEILLPRDLSQILQSHAGKEVYAGIRPGELRYLKRRIGLLRETLLSKVM